MQSPSDQDLAYERAVLSARDDPAMSGVVLESFLDEDDLAALRSFRESEDWSRILRFLDQSGVAAGARVIDFGGGRGLVAAALAGDGYRVVLCEPNPSAVCGSGAARRLREAAGLDFEIAAGDVAELEGGEFDAVVCRAVLHHVEPLVAVLASVCAALRPGGVLVCSDEPTIRDQGELPELRRNHPFVRYGVDENALTVAQYREAMEAAGFEAVRITFSISLGDYRRFVRPSTPAPLAVALYCRYRLRSALRPRPGDVRTIVARRPAVV
jgi:SAM-dependent methyltransferase